MLFRATVDRQEREERVIVCVFVGGFWEERGFGFGALGFVRAAWRGGSRMNT